MGHSSWSDDHYSDRAANRKATGASAFTYTDTTLKSTPSHLRKVHAQMDPNGVTRESRDSDAHPNSVAVSVLFDVTGSMQTIPRVLQENLPKLMGMLVRRGFLPDAQVMFGAIGDATCDQAPLQIGQFEAGIETDDDLGKIYLEGGGGGQNTESYELGMYAIARHTSIDCYEKRDKRGYLFIIADEKPYASVKRGEVSKVIGDSLQADIPLTELVDELLEKWDTYILMPSTGGAHKTDRTIKPYWVELFGQHVIEFDPANVSETIASIVGASEGFDTDAINSALDDVGSSHAKHSVSTALATVTKGGLSTSVVSGSLMKSGRKSSL